MSNPTFEEMEAKRHEMINSFKDIAAAMTRCVSIIEDYTRLSPSNPLSASDLETARAVNDTLSSFDPSLISAPHLDTFNQQPAHAAPAKKVKVKEPKEKKIKDPNAPKRPPSAYILYQNDVRDTIRQENPGIVYKDVLTAVSERWKGMTDEQKKEYDEAYQVAHSAFKQEQAAYDAKVKSAAAGAPVLPVETSDESDSDSDDSDSTPPAVQQPNVGVITPAMLSAAVTSTPVEAKKEKKRKLKETAVPVTPTVGDSEKKKKKKKKDEA